MHTPHSSLSRNRKPLIVVFTLTITFCLVEFIGGLLTNSLALLADAAHMLTDAGALGLALFAVWLSRKPATSTNTYGYYRVEILAALANGILLCVVAVEILIEAARRFQHPTDVPGMPIMIVAGIGLIVNLIGMWLLRTGSKESLNMQGAYLEVISDMLGSIGVIAAGAIMMTTGWYYADPLFSVLIGVFILPRTWKLMRQAVNVLLEGTPPHINIDHVRQTIMKSAGVVAIHDLHVWTITSGMVALSAHVVIKEQANSQHALDSVVKSLNESLGICHVTLQLETAACLETGVQH